MVYAKVLITKIERKFNPHSNHAGLEVKILFQKVNI